MSHSSATAALSDLGVSIWLDDLSRSRLTDGSLARLIREHHVVGVTTNPTIFANALKQDDSYLPELERLASDGMTHEQIAVELTCADVTESCALFTETYTASGGRDGRVSIEVAPSLADDTAATVVAGTELWNRIHRPNAMIKVPATLAGLEAITELTAQGISVNVTLIFSLSRYRAVVNAYLTGLERARAAGLPLQNIHSVASFFISRLDSAIDPLVRAAGADALAGKAGVANARLAYEIFTELFATERAEYLLAHGANVQRLLWASTGVKDPTFPDTLYVTELAGPETVNTLPEATLRAVIDHGKFSGDRLANLAVDSNAVLNEIAELGISYTDVMYQLEREAVEKFTTSWEEMIETVAHAVHAHDSEQQIRES